MSGRSLVGVFKQFIQTPIRYAVFVKKFLKKEESRFLIFTFGILKHQYIFDRKTMRVIRVETPTVEDFRVLLQVFYYEHYKINKSWSSIIARDASTDFGKEQRKLVLDLGGNIGLSALYFCLTIENATVVIVEPSERNILLAKKNTIGQDCIYIEGAISSKKGKAKLLDPGLGSDAYRVELDSAGSINVYTVNELIQNLSIKPFLVKIDIEGFEYNLFEKDTEWIDVFKVLVIELHDWMLLESPTSNNFLKEISKRNRRFIYQNENIFSF